MTPEQPGHCWKWQGMSLGEVGESKTSSFLLQGLEMVKKKWIFWGGWGWC